MLALLRRRNFALLWLAGAVSTLGDWILMVALPFFVYDLTGSALATGATFMASTLPRVFLSSVAGVLVDRWDRKWTLVLSDAARGLLLLPLLLVRSADTLWIVYVVATVQSSIAQGFIPAKWAFLPRLVDEGELLPANGLNSLSDNLTRLIGPALGGALYGALGLPVIVALNAGTFLVSAALLATISVSGAPLARHIATAARGAAALRGELVVGLRVVGGNRLLGGVFALFGIAMLGEGLLISLLVPFVKEVLGGSAAQLGWLMSAQAIGGLLGGLLVGRIGRLLPPLRLIAIAGILDGVLLLAIINSGSLGLAIGLMALAGLPVVTFFVSGQTLIQANTTDQFRGRVFGALSTVGALMTLIGMGLAALLGDRLGIVPTLSLGAIAYGLAGVAALALRPAIERPGRAPPDTAGSAAIGG